MKKHSSEKSAAAAAAAGGEENYHSKLDTHTLKGREKLGTIAFWTVCVPTSQQKSSCSSHSKQAELDGPLDGQSVTISVYITAHPHKKENSGN